MGILGANQTEDLLVARNEIVSSLLLLLLRSSVFNGRPYSDYIVKVFRLQRKTLLLFFGFCFPIIIIKVFRFQRKTLLLLYCFFFSILIIFFFLPILFRRFLENDLIDFHEIFTHDTL